FLLWYIRARRRFGPRTTSNKTARVAGSIAVAGFGTIIVAALLGYVALANYLSVSSLTAAYFAVALYAAVRILEGLVFFGLQIRPLASLAVVQHQRPLLRRRIAGLIEVPAIVAWALLALNAFSLREAVISRTIALLNAKVGVGSVHFSLGAVVA